MPSQKVKLKIKSKAQSKEKAKASSPAKKEADKLKELQRTFKPNLKPYQVLKMGSFGGTYWRPIYSGETDKSLKKQKLENQHLKYNWDLPDEILTKPYGEYDKNINKYKVKVGQTLANWEAKKWITKYDPYGWFQWYCNYSLGRRTPDDLRQLERWHGLAGPNGRFRKYLITLIVKKNGKWNDYSISPKIRQTLQHWGYKLTAEDFKKELQSRKEKDL